VRVNVEEDLLSGLAGDAVDLLAGRNPPDASER
jgi:hypothetical protein